MTASQQGDAAATGRGLRNQVLASICATFGLLGSGLALGYSSPAGPDLQRSSLHLDDSQLSLVGSMMPLGGLIGSMTCGWVMERLGRRNTMFMVSLPAVFGWLLITYAASFGPILAGRLLTGLTSGCCTVVVPVYVGEVCEPKIRGAMGATFEFQLTLGILMAYVIGKYAHWNFLAVVCACLVSVWTVLVWFIRESPVWLLKHGHDSQALETLLHFRGDRHEDVDNEMKALREQLEYVGERNVTIRDLVNRDNRRPFMISMMAMMLQQLCGINAVVFYSTDIFEDAGSSIESSTATIIVGLVRMVSTFAAVVLVDRLGRKLLLLTSEVIMAVCLLVLGIYFYLKTDGGAESIGWLPLVSLMIYIFAFSIGIGPISWLIMGELFAPEVKGAASGTASSFSSVLFFLVTLTFTPLVNGITEAGVFWLFSAICFGGVGYVAVFFYETKGKTLQEIQDHFRSNQ